MAGMDAGKQSAMDVGVTHRSEDGQVVGFLAGCRGHAMGQRYALTGSEFVIGREQTECDLVLSDHRISLKHATIETQARKFFVVDNNSSNGTYINGKKISRRQLKNGDRLGIGDQVFRFWKVSTQELKENNGCLKAPTEVPPSKWSRRIVFAAVLLLTVSASYWLNADRIEALPKISELSKIDGLSNINVFSQSTLEAKPLLAAAEIKVHQSSAIRRVPLVATAPGRIKRVLETDAPLESGVPVVEFSVQQYKRKLGKIQAAIESLEAVVQDGQQSKSAALLTKRRKQLLQTRKAMKQPELLMPQSGRVVSFEVAPGDTVKSGDVIGMIEVTE